jgi:hypothetical protein
LEREEELVEARQEIDDDSDDLDEEEYEMLEQIREKKKSIRFEKRLAKARNSTAIPEAQKKVAHPMKVEALAKHLRGRGLAATDADAIADRVRSRSKSTERGRSTERAQLKRKRSIGDDDDAMDTEGNARGRSASREARSVSRSQSRGPNGRPRSDSILGGRGLTPAPGEGFKDAEVRRAPPSFVATCGGCTAILHGWHCLLVDRRRPAQSKPEIGRNGCATRVLKWAKVTENMPTRSRSICSAGLPRGISVCLHRSPCVLFGASIVSLAACNTYLLFR